MTSEKADQLHQSLGALGRVAIAYSGGVDSAFLMEMAHRALGPASWGVLADSASLPRREKAEALALAAARGWRVTVIETRELENPAYASNPPNRCYFCKAELFLKLESFARERGIPHLAYGENADDAADFRPGRQAADSFRVIAPLRDAGLTKAEIRELSRGAGLPTAEKPALPCLASRLPTGVPVTPEALASIEAGEAILRAEGFRILRLRHLADGHAKVLVGPDETPRLLEPAMQARLTAALESIGYARVDFDPQGYAGPSLR